MRRKNLLLSFMTSTAMFSIQYLMRYKKQILLNIVHPKSHQRVENLESLQLALTAKS